MSSNGTHERHVASCHWVEIYIRWIKGEVKSKSTNGRLTCGNERTSLLTLTSPNRLDGGKERENRERKERGKRKEESFRVRSSHFSLNFLVIGPSVLVGTRGEVGLRCKGYAWVPVLWSFDNSER